MNLRWRAFEQRLAARVRPYDARRRMRFWQRVEHFLNSSPDLSPWLGRGLASLWPVICVAGQVENIGQYPDLAMAWLGLWGMLIAVLRAGFWTNGLPVQEYATFTLLPVPANRVFQHLARRFGLGLFWPFAESLLVYGLVAVSRHGDGRMWAGVVVCAAMQAGFQGALTAGLIAGKAPLGRILVPVLLAAMALACVSRPQTEVFLAQALYVANPMGWVNAVCFQGWMLGQAAAAWWLLPVLGGFATLPFSARRLRRRTYAREFPCSNRAPGDLVWPAPRPEQPILEVGAALRPVAWDRLGWLDRLMARVLTPRERLVAECATLAGPSWTRHFRDGAAGLAVYLLAGACIPFASLDDLVSAFVSRRPDLWWGLAITGVACLAFVLMVLKALLLFSTLGWPEFERRPAASQRRPPYRGFRLLPMTFGEIVKAKVKVDSLVLLLLLPLASCLNASAGFQRALREAPHSPLIAPKCLLLAWGWSLLLYSIPRLAPVPAHGWRMWRALLLFGLVYAGVLAETGALLVSPDWRLDLLVCTLWCLTVLGLLAACGSLHRRRRFGRRA